MSNTSDQKNADQKTAGLSTSDVSSNELPLGKHSEYVSTYTPSLLFPIPRIESRKNLSLEDDDLPFTGMDIWTAYELSWLDAKGMPHVAVAEFHFPCHSRAIIESKSFKLYLNSFNQTRFNSILEVVATLESDLTTEAGAPVMVNVTLLHEVEHQGIGHFAAEHLDNLQVDITDYHPNESLLCLEESEVHVTESFYSDLLKTNCPVTGQPDWASVYIHYSGVAINKESLLKYIVSFREHQDFHEHCVERMFVDIQNICKPDKLTVYARYTRRGGLDINPFRTNADELPSDVRLVRQ